MGKISKKVKNAINVVIGINKYLNKGNSDMRNFYNIIALLVILFMGCSDLEQNNEEYDKAELLRVLDEDDAIGIDGFDDGGVIDLDYNKGLEVFGLGRAFGDTLNYGEGYRIRFGRQITNRERTVDFTIEGDIAIGVVSYLINGVFIAEARDTSTMEAIDSIGFLKDFTSTMIRKVKYERVDDSNSPEGYSWRIIALTPLYGGAGDKVSITSIDIYEFNLSLDEATGITGEEGDLVFSISSDGIGDLYINRDNLPTFNSFEYNVVKVAVENNGPEYAIDSTGVGEWAMLRYGRSANQRGRQRLNDNGIGMDAVVNDNIHTNVWRMHGPGIGRETRVFRSFFSTVDLATLFIGDGGYNSATWSIPYRSQRPE